MVPYIVMALIYIVLVLLISLLVKVLENIFARSEKNKMHQKKAKAV
jgi:polar amino acid transport system permease protein